MPGDGGFTNSEHKVSQNGPSSAATSAKKRLKLYRSRSNTDSEILPQRMSLLASGEGCLLEKSNENAYAPHRYVKKIAMESFLEKFVSSGK